MQGQKIMMKFNKMCCFLGINIVYYCSFTDIRTWVNKEIKKSNLKIKPVIAFLCSYSYQK